MSAFGCESSPKPPQLLLKEAEVPKVQGWVLERPAKPSCLDPGKKDYSVEELEKARDCERTYTEKLEYRHGALSKVVKEIEKK